MAINDQLDKPVPVFRADLEIYRGPDEADGSPSYNIYDPLRSIYFKVSWAELEILQQMKHGITFKELFQNIYKNTTLKVTPEEVMAFMMQLQSQGLIEGYQEAKKLFAKAKKERHGWFMWVLWNYLFIKLPLFNPDQFLERMLPTVQPLMSKRALIIYMGISLWGMVLVLTNWSQFINTFTYFFNVEGVVAYTAAIAVTKVIHEFSHAFVAKKYGLRVPSMGVALLVLMPVMFTDVTDAWRLHNRKHRLLISAAGVIAEMVLAGIATVGWAFSPPGVMQSVFFIVASLNWISTLVINLNPALRFDGYYLLSDVMGVENLQQRAFTLLRYEFYRLAAGAKLPDAEPRMTRARKRWMIVYALYTWAYRLFLYTAIALLVYHQFTKAVGVFLFLLEIAVFFIWPIVDEVIFFRKMRRFIEWNFRLKVVSFALVTFLIWFIVPWPVWVKMPAITIPHENRAIIAPMAGVVQKIYIVRGQTVKKGDPIVWIKAYAVENQIDVLTKEREILKKQLDITQLTEANLQYYTETQTKLAQTEAELEGLRTQKDNNLIKAKEDGVIYQWDDYLRDLQPVGVNRILGQLAPMEKIDVVGFIHEDTIEYVRQGGVLKFAPHGDYKTVTGVVVSISPIRLETLNYPQLASVYHGDLPVLPGEHNKLKFVGSYYSIIATIDTREDLRFGRTGYVEFWGPWRSRAFLFAEWTISIIIRESGF